MRSSYNHPGALNREGRARPGLLAGAFQRAAAKDFHGLALVDFNEDGP